MSEGLGNEACCAATGNASSSQPAESELFGAGIASEKAWHPESGRRTMVKPCLEGACCGRIARGDGDVAQNLLETGAKLFISRQRVWVRVLRRSSVHTSHT